MEDEFVASTKYGHSLLAVFDGHGGGKASQFCKENIEDLVYTALLERLSPDGRTDTTTKSSVLDTAITKLDFKFCAMARERGLADGTTSIIAVTDGKEVVVANVGDSRAVLCRRGRAIPLSIDHKPDREDERKRITDVSRQQLYSYYCDLVHSSEVAWFI